MNLYFGEWFQWIHVPIFESILISFLSDVLFAMALGVQR